MTRGDDSALVPADPIKEIGRKAGALVVGVAAVEAFNEFGLARDLAVLGGFCIALLGVGTLAFRTMRL